MNKEMNKLLLQTTKHDLGSCVLVSLLVALFSTFVNAGIYVVGLCVALANFLAYGYIIKKCLGKGIKQVIMVITFFLRIGFIVVITLPFIKNIEYMSYYMFGFVSHYILLIGFNIINRKGSD